MLPIHKIIWHEYTTKEVPVRENEPEVMNDLEQVKDYVKAYEWGGPTSALQLHHLKEVSQLIRPGDTVLDLACGPGPLLLELAGLYPECNFVGVDLAPMMLQHLKMDAEARGMKNVSVLQEDIRELPDVQNGSIDLVITTSSLHHLPDEGFVKQVFTKIRSVLKPDGAFYIFDFAQLRSAKTRKIMVDEVAKLAPPLTALDYDLSLKAAYPVSTIIELAQQELPKPFTASISSFCDFFYFLQSPPRTKPSAAAQNYMNRVWRSLAAPMKVEHLMLRVLRTKRTVSS
jgi:arsenite methyltransferase